ncbi:trypsin family protein [Corynebacterium simulans]|nr:trypsin family protein [Corynebacterium simulans]
MQGANFNQGAGNPQFVGGQANPHTQSFGAGQPGQAGQFGQPGQPNQAITYVGAQPNPPEKKKVGLGTALAMMLAGAVAVGSITGLALGAKDKNDTSTVNQVLQNEPVANSTGEEPAEGSVEATAAKVLPAVVSIEALGLTSAAEGSGSIISPDGYVLTNHHVVAGAERGGQLRVSMNDGSKHEAEFISSDANTDVAIIKIKDVNDLPFLQFGDSDAVAVGQEVVAVGSPLGLNATVTSGIVSAKNRPVRASQEGGESSLIDAIQTDAAVNPGNSGGPLVDINGNLIGMNSMIASLSSSGSSEAGSIGLGFAIPSNFAKRMADQLINKGEVKHPTLGVKVDARDSGDGARIVEVEPGSPAEEAGLNAGDLVTRVNDRRIENSDSLIAAARSQDFGAKVTLEVSNGEGKDPRQVEVTLSDE